LVCFQVFNRIFFGKSGVARHKLLGVKELYQMNFFLSMHPPVIFDILVAAFQALFAS
jgi:hypothetical protein